MAVTIASDQAVFQLATSDVAPNLQPETSRNLLFGHLTRGWDGRDWTGDALTCSASVPVTGPDSEVDAFELGFVQLARATSFKAFYAGRVTSEGGIALDYFRPPALSDAILLDATKTARDPWYRNPVFGTAAPNRRTAEFGDHPGMVVFLRLQNRSRSNVPNFLFHVFMEREFWTVLTGRETSGKLHFIAYFQWQLRYEFKLNWVNGDPVLRQNSSSFRVVKGKTTGPPPDSEVQPKLASPSGERANSVGRRAEAITVTGSSPNRSDLPSRFITVPADFWL